MNGNALGSRARLIVTITALAESDLHNYANPVYPLSLQVPNDGVPPRGADADSCGIFQQRPKWWGTGTTDERVRQIMNPSQSAGLFLNALQHVPGWETLEPWVAAQAVQRSAFADGSNYRARVEQARKLLGT